MIIPQIHGINKIRDMAICRDYVRDGTNSDELAVKYGVCASRVRQILYKNRVYLKSDKEYEKLKRISHLKRLLNKHPENIGKKDTLDILDQLRVETEGNKNDNSHIEYHKTIINYPANWKPKEERVGDNPTAIPGRLPLF